MMYQILPITGRSLLSSTGKVLEKSVHKHIFNFFGDNQVITPLQLRFFPGDSTVNHLVDIYTITHSERPRTKVNRSVCRILQSF